MRVGYINTYVSLMYELEKIGKIFTSKSVGTGPSSFEKRIYRAAVSQRLRNTALWDLTQCTLSMYQDCVLLWPDDGCFTAETCRL